MENNGRIFITGASSGIGSAVASQLVKKGWKVGAFARNTSLLNELAQSLTGSAGELLPITGDVTDPRSVASAVDQIVDGWGGLDAVIPNAGLGYFDPLPLGKLDEWHEMIDVNIKGVLNTLHAALPVLAKHRGHVINIGSLAARQVFPNSGVYCATKHAVLALSDSIRLEYRNDIAVTTINPGAVNTPFIDRTTNEALRADYRPQFDEGMSADFVADAIVAALEAKGRGVFSEVTLRPDRR
jgi:NADP-dependent 3-hydroxy acid dehydrogenase YdfG